MRPASLLLCAVAGGCAHADDLSGRSDGSALDDASVVEDGSLTDDATADDAGDSDSASSVSDSRASDTGGMPTADAGTDTSAKDTAPVTTDTATGGPVTGGPCLSGAKGATAFRIRWVNSGGKATVSYEVIGLPDKSGFKVAAYSMSFGYTPTYGDVPLSGIGGLELDTGQFVDVDLSTIGITSITSARLSLYGRSYATSSNGSFTWQTGDGYGSSLPISNAVPYHWDGIPITLGLPPGKLHKLRIKPGPPSGSLAVNRIELCVEAS